jgi:hypothetical protein
MHVNLHPSSFVCIYLMQLRLLLLPVLLLASCRSEQVAFQFTPVSRLHAEAAMPVPQAAVVSAESTLEALSTEAALATRPSAVPPRHSKGLAGRLAPLKKAPEMAGRKTEGWATRPPPFLGQHPTERALLIGGAGTTLLGLLSNYLAMGAGGSRMLLLNTGHYLLVIGSFLLLAWFVLLLVRALKE